MSDKIARSAYSRVFLIDGRARVDHVPSYKSCLRMTGLSQGFGDIERVECPDPWRYGSFIEVAEIRGATERPTTSLEGRYSMDTISALLSMASKGCKADVQLHWGECEDPTDFNAFKKILILEDAALINYSTDDLGVLQSGDNAAVNETADLSARKAYEVVPLAWASQAAGIVTNEVLDVVICDTVSCGDCDTESDGCYRIYAITKGAGGSPSTPPDIVFSIDKGSTWYAHDIDTLLTAEDPSAIGCLGNYVVVVANSTNSLHYVLKSELNGTTDPAFTEVATGFVTGGEPNDIDVAGNYAFIVGDFGYVYGTADPTAGVDVLDAGSATIGQLNAVDAFTADLAVAVGNGGAVIYTENQTLWTRTTTSPVGVGVNLISVKVRGEKEWWVGTSTGRLFYTLDKGVTWHEKTFSGSGTGTLDAIEFATDSVGAIAHATTAPRARVFRSYDAFESFKLTPEAGGTLPLADRINAMAMCSQDPNFIVAVGLGDDGADGFIAVGSG